MLVSGHNYVAEAALLLVMEERGWFMRKDCEDDFGLLL